jgi:hypothetical protein
MSLIDDLVLHYETGSEGEEKKNISNANDNNISFIFMRLQGYHKKSIPISKDTWEKPKHATCIPFRATTKMVSDDNRLPDEQLPAPVKTVINCPGNNVGTNFIQVLLIDFKGVFLVAIKDITAEKAHTMI